MLTGRGNSRYTCDSKKLQELRTLAPWTKDPKFLKKVAISPSAVMKIMMHCHSGVTKGLSKGGNPIEVMGMLLGRPDPTSPETLVVTDAFPLPIEGFETRVIADDENVVNHMIALGESLERTRKERFFGWYHSHPFDLGDHSHCFLSQTDLSTQLQWQRAEDPHGNPFVAIVVDPLRSAHHEQPELKAFRAYPPEYTSPVANECPDGSVEESEQLRLEHWGSCWNRYYELDVEYFMSSTSRTVLERLTQEYLWIRSLHRQSDEVADQKLAAAAKQCTVAAKSPTVALTQPTGPVGARGPAGRSSAARVRAEQGLAAMSVAGGAAPVANENPRLREWNKATAQLSEVASDSVWEQTLQKTKETIFG